MTSYLTSIDTFSLSCTVFEIFDFNVFRVWPWPLTFKGHLRSKIYMPFESLYILFLYYTSIDTFSISRTVSKKNRFKILKVAWNGGIWPFQGQGHWPIFFISRKGSDSCQTALIDISRVKIGFGCTIIKERKKLKKRKRTNSYMLGICTSIPENFSETKFC